MAKKESTAQSTGFWEVCSKPRAFNCSTIWLRKIL